MTGIDDLIRRVALRAAEDAREWGRELPAVLSRDDLECLEQRLGYALHPVLARLYCEVANGGFGPDYLFRALPTDGSTPAWRGGMLWILDWGCGMSAVVDCLSLDGTVVLHEPNGLSPDSPEHEGWFLDSPSLVAWLEKWLADDAWFSEDADPDDPDGRNPRPWPDAERRMAQWKADLSAFGHANGSEHAAMRADRGE